MMNKLYRPNAGIVLFNREGKVFVCARADKKDMQWQFPQGGIDDGETAEQAAVRELKEETGITSAKLVYAAPQTIKYDYPPLVLKKFQKLGRPHIGQEQHWFLFFYDSAEKPDFTTHPEEIEFKACEWVGFGEAVKRIIGFKKESYQYAQSVFEPVIAAYLEKKKKLANPSVFNVLNLQRKRN